MPRLSTGSQGPEVKLAQAALNFHAMKGDLILEVDGKFGNDTRNRVIAFQRAAGLVDDGIIGTNTEAVLFATVETVSVVRFTGPMLRMPQPRFMLSPNVPKPLLPPLTLPPLTLPGLGTPPPQLPGFTFSMPLAQGQSAIMAPRTGNGPTFQPVDLFTIKGTVFKHVRLKLAGEVEATTELDGSSKIETVVKSEVGILKGDALSIDAYIKAKGEIDPADPGKASVKGGGGVRFTLKLGQITLETSLGVDVLKLTPGTGEVKGGVIWAGGTLDIARF
jgi:hypothetical protein